MKSPSCNSNARRAETSRVAVAWGVWRRVFIFAVAAIVLYIPANRGAAAADGSFLPKIETLRIGFGNHYKLGCWTPVQIGLGGAPGDSGAAGRLDVGSPDGDGVLAWSIGPRVTWTAKASNLAYTRIGRAEPPSQVRLTKFHKDGEDLPESLRIAATEFPVAIPTANEFIVEVGNSIGLDEMFHGDQTEGRQADVVEVAADTMLPDRWYGYEGVDLLAIAGADACAKIGDKPAQVAAIERWVREGGTLLLACAEGAKDVFDKGKPLASFAPGEFDGMVTLQSSDFGEIEAFAAGNEDPRRLDARRLHVPQWRGVPADHTVAGSRSLPIITRTPLGFGEVIFVGLDLHKAPFLLWSGRSKLLERLVHPGAASKNGAEMRNPGKRLGFVDLSGQLRGALDQFEGVEVTPFWVIFLTALIFVLLLFPTSYWVVTRWLNRQWVAWILLPIALVGFCFGAWALANYAKGDQQRANQVDLVDIDLRDGSVRGTTWFDVFSPANELYDLQLRENFAGMHKVTEEARTQPLLSWFGVAGTGLGGMSSGAASQPLFDEPYTISPEQGTIEGAPIPVWSSKSFVARWSARGGGMTAELTATPLTAKSNELGLHGSIKNELGTSLTDCAVFYRGVVYQIGLFKTEAVKIDQLESQAAKYYFSKRPKSLIKDETPPYDYAGFNVPRILEMMMFHERAGGANYTGLSNRHQQYIDLSRLMEKENAILVGIGPPGATVQVNDRTLDEIPLSRHKTIYRFILPVQVPHSSTAN
jgi:hypothetical protein